MLAAAPLIDPILFGTHHTTGRLALLGSYATSDGDFAEIKSEVAVIESLAVELGDRQQMGNDPLWGG
jgi:hypothetical protein